MSKWHENIPDSGVLVTDSVGTLHIVGYVEGSIAMTPVSDIVSTSSIIDYVADLTPITANKWWELAPWQPIETAPLNKRIFTISIYGELSIEAIRYESTKGWFKKWLPLPDNVL